MSFDLFLTATMSCYIRKLLPRGSSILSGAPFTTSSSRPRLMGPPSQLVSRKIALRPVQGPRHYSRQHNDDDDGGGGGKGFWVIIKHYGSLFLSSPGALAASTFALYIIWNIRPSRVNQRRNKPIDDLLVGDIPVSIFRHQMEIKREEIITSIKKEFIKPESSDDLKKFGIILGPGGTGKSLSTQIACNQNSFGVLYTHIGGNLVDTFAEQTGVPIQPRGLFDSIAKHTDRIHYYKLKSLDNKDEFGALMEIIAILSEQAREFKKKHNQIPCLFIDGAGLLAKEFPSRFFEMVTQAKIYANEGILRIIFVSEEGHIMSLFQSASSSSRAAKIMEIVDVDDKEGKEYLVENGLPPGLSEKVVKYTGGRIFFLLDAICKYNEYVRKTKKISGNLTIEDEEKLLEEIKEYLHLNYTLWPYIKMLSVDGPTLKLLLKEMSSGCDQCIRLNEVLMKVKEKKDIDCIKMTVKSLVEANVFRYDGEGLLRYHNRLIENDIKNNLHRL